MTVRIGDKVNAKVGLIVTGFTFAFYLLYCFGGLSRVGVYMNELQNLAVGLLLVLLLVFIYYPLKKQEAARRMPWYDIIFMLVSLAFSVYIVVAWDSYWMHVGFVANSLELVLGLMSIVIIIEAVRRTTGMSMVVVIFVFLCYGMFGNYIPGFLHTSGASLRDMSGHMWLGQMGIYGLTSAVIIDYIFAFLLFSAVLQNLGGAELFGRLTHRVLGKYRGGSAKIAIALNYLIGWFSGSSVANCYMTGPLNLPRMRAEGYSKEYAGGIIATAGNAAVFTPPVMGITAFVMAEFMSVSYLKICIWGAIPAFFYFLSLFMFADLEAGRKRMRPLPISGGDGIPIRKILLDGWHVIVGLIVLIMLMGGMFTTVRLAAVIASLVVVLLWLLRERTRKSVVVIGKVVQETIRNLIAITPICAGAGLIIGVVGITSLDFKFSFGLTNLMGDNVFLLVSVAALACFVLGMGIPPLPAYIIVVLLVIPPLVHAGIPLVATHFFVFYWSLTGMITPPVCLNVYVVAPMVESSMWRVGLSAVRIGIASYVLPYVFIYRPGILFVGSALDILSGLFIALLETIGLCFALTKYGLTEGSWLESIVAFIGVMLIIPPIGLLNFIGGVLLIVVTVIQVKKWRGSNGSR